AEAIDRLTGALVDGDAGAGIGVLAELDERGRDVAVVLDQILDQIRTDLGAAIGPAGQPARAAALSAAAHRLAAIDPERRGVGGLRFQIELALLDAATRAPSTARQRPAGPEAAAVTEPEAAAVTEPVPAPVAAAPVDAAPAPPAAAAAEPAAPAPAARAERAPAPTPEIDARPRRTARHEPVASTPRSAAADPAEPAATEASNTAPATEAPPVDPSSPQGIDELRAAWPAIVAALSQSPPVKPLIAACRPVSLDGAIVTLGFPEDQAFLKDALERRRAMLEQGIGAILGRPVSVHCVATNLDHVPAIPLTEAADLISE